MSDNGALHCRVILSQILPSSTADRGRSRLGHLSQPRLFHGGDWGLLSLNNCSLPAEMQMCSQWRGFNLWRGQEGKERGRSTGFRLSICSLPSTRLFRGLESICLYFKGNWAQMPRRSGRRRRAIGQGLEMGWDPAKIGLRGLLWAWERGEELQRLPSLPSPLWILTWRTWPYDTPPESSGGKEDGSSLEQSTGGAKWAREDFLSSSVWYKGRAGLSPLPKCAKVRTV